MTGMPHKKGTHNNWVPRTALIFCLLLYCVLGLGMVFLSDLQVGDENWHFSASSLVSEGKVPYRDFAYFHMPLVPYLYGIGMYFFGAKLIVGRLISFLLGLFTLLLVYKAARKIKGGYAGIFAILPIVCNFGIIFQSTFFYWGPLENFLLALFCFVLVSSLKPEIKCSICVFLLVLVQGVRYFVDNAAVYTILFAVFALFLNRKNKKVFIGVALAYLVGILLVYLPGLIFAPKEFLFDTLTHYFSKSKFVFTIGKDFGADYTPTIFIYDRLKQSLSLFRNYYIIALSFFLMVLYGLRGLFYTLKSGGTATSFTIRYQTYLILATLPLLNGALFLSIFGHYLHCFLYHAFPAWAILFGCCIAKILEYLKAGKERLFFSVFIVSAIVLNLFTQEIEHYISSPKYSGAKFLEAVSQAVRRNSKSEDKVFSFINGYVLNAGRQIFTDTIYDISSTSLFPRLSDKDALRYGLLSPNILLSYFKDKRARVVIFEKPGRLDLLSGELRGEIERAISENYYLAEVVRKYADKDVAEPAVFIYKAK